MVAFPETADIETASDDYARRFAGSVGKWFLDVQTAATLRLLAPYSGARVLDVGGGHGQIAGALVEQGFDVTVLGSDEVCKARIQKLLDERRAAFQIGNVLDLPYPDRHVDVVISYRLLPHVAQWQRFLAELCRVARQAVIVDYPEVRSVNAVAPLLFGLKKQLEGNTRTYISFRQADLLAEFQRNGFVYSDQYKEFFFPMVLHRKLGAPRLSAALESGARALQLTRLLGSPVILKVVREGQ
ncbi:MAG: methyltransferase domain-containing protein [Chloroflexi bacterium]|nr:methyltransferase domain-containing protein [Chloroflexota bacterium]